MVAVARAGAGSAPLPTPPLARGVAVAKNPVARGSGGYDQRMVTVTAAAAAQIRRFAEAEGEPAQLRLAIQGGGCSGFQYALGFDDAAADDLVVDCEGVQILIDPFSLPYLKDTVIDWQETIAQQGFAINNPHARAACGCGSSFQVDEQAAEDAPATTTGACNGCG
jgi:iron-sulfur cluster insertion protein